MFLSRLKVVEWFLGAGSLTCLTVAGFLSTAGTRGEARDATHRLQLVADYDLGRLELGEIREIEVLVTNPMDVPVRILGCNAHCGQYLCSDAGNLPLTIPSRSSEHIRVDLGIGGSPGVFNDSLTLYTDNSEVPDVSLTFRGTVSGTDVPEGVRTAQ